MIHTSNNYKNKFQLSTISDFSTKHSYSFRRKLEDSFIIPKKRLPKQVKPKFIKEMNTIRTQNNKVNGNGVILISNYLNRGFLSHYLNFLSSFKSRI